MGKLNDNILQLIFVAGLLAVLLVIFNTRISGSRAGEESTAVEKSPYATLQTVFQFEQEERRLEAKIKASQGQYAADIALFAEAYQSIKFSNELSELEKREKEEQLRQIYSESYFERRIAQIDEDRAALEALLAAKCRLFCRSQDLPDVF